MKNKNSECIIVTAGSTYLDIDAYACCVAMTELLKAGGKEAIAYSSAPWNYSVCKYLTAEGQIERTLPSGLSQESSEYVIVDVSDPHFLKESVPLENVIAVYDHHAGYEDYWHDRIGENAHIEFIGAAATLIYCEWKAAGLLDKMKESTAKLLIAAILDNTLNLTSQNTTPLDIEVFEELCKRERVGEEWCASYFSEVAKSIDADLENALLKDVKSSHNNAVLPANIGQLCVWDAAHVLKRLPEIRGWFENRFESWMINIIDIKHRCSYFVCDDEARQREMEKVFAIQFDAGVAQTMTAHLRKEILKKTQTW